MQKPAKQFINLLETQQLLSPEILSELRRQLADSKTRLTTELLAKLLVDNGHLTKFQATKLIAEIKESDASSDIAGGDDDEELGFAEEASMGKPTTSHSSGTPVANVFDDDELDFEPQSAAAADQNLPTPRAARVEATPIAAAADLTPPRPLAVDLSQVDVPLTDVFGQVPSAAQRVVMPKAAKANPYDSFRILGVGVLLALVLVAGFFLVTYFWRGNADERLKRADGAYEQRSYETAATIYKEFAQDFPANEKVSYAKVRAGLASIRQAAEGAPDPKQGLKRALEVLPALAGEPSLLDQQSDLAGTLISLAAKFNERADRTQATTERKTLMTDMDQLLGLINDPQFVGTNQRNQQAPTLNRIQEDRQRILREINRDEELATTLSQIDEKLAAQDTVAAYLLRSALINHYPQLETDAALMQRVIQASSVQRSLVQPGKLSVQLDNQPPHSAVGRSFLLANRSGNSAAALKGQILFVKAKGSVYGIDGASGDILWRQFVGREFASEPIRIADASTADAIICQPETGQVQRLSGKSGETIWHADLGMPMCNPLAEGDDLLAVTLDGTIASLSASGGQLKWATQLPQSASVTPGAAQGKPHLYAPADHSNLYVLSRADGACADVFYLGHRSGSIVVPPILLLNQLFIFENVNADTAKIRILTTSDAGLELRDAQAPFSMEGNIVATPQVDGRRLIVQTDLGQIKVFDIEPTAKTQPVSELVTIPPNVFEPKQSWLIADNNRVWVVDNQLTRFDLQVASQKMTRAWIKNDGDRFAGPPQQFNNILIHTRTLRGNQGVRISAVEADTGNSIWDTDLGMPVVFLGSNGSRYDAINTSGMLFVLGNNPIRTNADENPGQGKPAAHYTDPTRLADGRTVLKNKSRGNQFAIYTPTAEFRLSLLAARFGAAQPTSQLQAVGDTVAVGLDSGQMVLLDLAAGGLVGTPYQPAMKVGQKVHWNKPAYVADSQTLIAASDLQQLVRLSANNGLQVLNEVILEQPLVGPLVGLGDQVGGVESTTSGDILQFFDATNFSKGPQWRLPDRRVSGPFAVATAVTPACLLQTDSKLSLVSKAGKLLWSIDFPNSSLVGPPLEANAQWIVATRSGSVWSISPESGEVNGNLEVGQALSSSPLLLNNGLLIGSDEGAVLALPIPTTKSEQP